jgi:hypothetical protein
VKDELEVRFISSKNPVVYVNNKEAIKISSVFWQSTNDAITVTGNYLYYKDTATTLVRVEFSAIRERIQAGETMVQTKEISKEVQSFYAQGPSYWILNKEGEIRSFGPVTAIMRLGPSIKITSTSTLVPLGLNLLACWHSLTSNKNHYVLFSKQMEFFSCLSMQVKQRK